MAYSDFTMRKLNTLFGITEQNLPLFDKKDIILVEPSAHLRVDIEDAAGMPVFSEKAKSELLISPILKEVWKHANRQFFCYSGYSLDVDKEKGLNGVCDFLFSKEYFVTEVATPVFCLVEAKNRAIEEGIPQVVAEMYAAQLLNTQQETPLPIIYGCVSNGFDWQFLALKGNIVTADTMRYYADEATLPKLLGILTHIVKQYN